MINNHFVISQRDNIWQFSFRGDVSGPFTSKSAAVAAAIATASKVGDTDVEVVVHDAELRAETVWRTGQHDAPGS
jgi:hypothetical protein